MKYGVGVEGYLNAVTNAVTPEAKAHNAEAEAHNARLDENIKKVAEAVADIAARLDAAIVQEQIATEAWLQAMVQQLLQPAPTTDTATPAPKADSEWVTKAQARAREIVKKSKELDRYPNQENLGDMVAAEFRKAGIVGADGKPLTGATIKRHALKGISSATGKQLSTTIAQGK